MVWIESTSNLALALKSSDPKTVVILSGIISTLDIRPAIRDCGFFFNSRPYKYIFRGSNSCHLTVLGMSYDAYSQNAYQIRNVRTFCEIINQIKLLKLLLIIQGNIVTFEMEIRQLMLNFLMFLQMSIPNLA